MLKKSILTTLAGLLLSTNASAMQLNILYGDDIIHNQDKIHFAYQMYYNKGNGDINLGDEHYNVEGVPVAHMPELTALINSTFANIQPTDSLNGKHSEVTLGYQKADGNNYFPATCAHIRAANFMNILMTEEGCTVTVS